jgi:hypothetical protein
MIVIRMGPGSGKNDGQRFEETVEGMYGDPDEEENGEDEEEEEDEE